MSTDAENAIVAYGLGLVDAEEVCDRLRELRDAHPPVTLVGWRGEPLTAQEVGRRVLEPVTRPLFAA